jgi:outer membrane protein
VSTVTARSSNAPLRRLSAQYLLYIAKYSVMRTLCFRLAGSILAVWLHAAGCFAADQSSDSAAMNGPVSEGAGPRWFFRAGPTGLFFDSSAKIALGGKDLAGASLTASNNGTLIIEGGYFITRDIAVEISGGIPPTTTFTGKGTIAGLGELGKATYGPAVFSVNYYFKGLGSLRPYLGVGEAYAFIFSTKDGAVRDLHVNGNRGFVVQGGFDYRVTKNWSVFADLKHISLKVNARGELLNAPVTASVTLDPTIASLGISYHW